MSVFKKKRKEKMDFWGFLALLTVCSLMLGCMSYIFVVKVPTNSTYISSTWFKKYPEIMRSGETYFFFPFYRSIERVNSGNEMFDIQKSYEANIEVKIEDKVTYHEETFFYNVVWKITSMKEIIKEIENENDDSPITSLIKKYDIKNLITDVIDSFIRKSLDNGENKINRLDFNQKKNSYEDMIALGLNMRISLVNISVTVDFSRLSKEKLQISKQFLRDLIK